MKECILEVGEGKGGIYTIYHFVGSNNLRFEISLKKRRQQKKGALKQRTETPLCTCIEVFLLFFLVIKKNNFLFFYSIFMSICLEK